MKRTTLPKLMHETEQFIEELCQGFSIQTARTLDGDEREIHFGHFVPKKADYEAIYHARNPCLPLLFLVRRIADYEKDLAAGHYDTEKFLEHEQTRSKSSPNESGTAFKEPHDSPEDRFISDDFTDIYAGETSLSEFVALADAARQRHEENWSILNRIRRFAIQENDENFRFHDEFAFKFAKDVHMDRIRRLALLDMTQSATSGRPMTLAEIREALVFWHRIEVAHCGIIRNDCIALNIKYSTEQEKATYQKKCLEEFLRSPNASTLIEASIKSKNCTDREMEAYQLLKKFLESPEDRTLIASALKLLVVQVSSEVDYLPISDELWKRIQPLLPRRTNTHRFGGGRPPTPDRSCLNGIFFILRTGRPWKALDNLGICPGSTAHERFDNWRKAGVFDKFRKAGLMEHDDLKSLDWSLLE